ncbi:DUF4870 domain-containing protein [uncultured Tessaracoccus sp.]|uniref:DUF4870 domain-containing protein n=1 Tax=uncultured Tessaracoccus sp. TaxID=905023 RepID=UPI0026362A55|nr:DUF4870 domain-containing protein [uncultured Tessaracoccus sp.]
MSQANNFPPNNPHPGGYQPRGNSSENTMAMLAHVLGIVTAFIGPLIIWLVSKDDPRKAFSTDQAKEALNFQITVAIGYIISGALSFVFIGLVTGPIIGILNLVFCILAALAANKGETYRYPFALRLVK